MWSFNCSLPLSKCVSEPLIYTLAVCLRGRYEGGSRYTFVAEIIHLLHGTLDSVRTTKTHTALSELIWTPDFWYSIRLNLLPLPKASPYGHSCTCKPTH